MGYIGIDNDYLIQEIELIMKNNFGSDVTRENFNRRFELTARDILKSIKSIINSNKSIVKRDFNNEWSEE